MIELLVVISIITLLISILMPSLGRAREQAKSVHCLARLKDMGTALAAYENVYSRLPSALWNPEELETLGDPPLPLDEEYEYGWVEILFTWLYGDQVRYPANYPVQRNINQDKRGEYFLCRAAGVGEVSSGHYRVYLPAWSAGSYRLNTEGQWDQNTIAIPTYSAMRDRIRPKLPMIGDANEFSERGDGLGIDDCSYIAGGEANYAGTNGRDGNRFSDRHYGGTNFLFQDLHATWNVKLREILAVDYDLNGIEDVQILP